MVETPFEGTLRNAKDERRVALLAYDHAINLHRVAHGALKDRRGAAGGVATARDSTDAIGAGLRFGFVVIPI
jgi:hypothetical protein